uniref:G_PROTEIN_RECEP_F1_2 domain-containing protein n=2 Tax=Caenorhabditis tropicalis TaxID=1561998 RepID=A0A1I7V422_9PELO
MMSNTSTNSTVSAPPAVVAFDLSTLQIVMFLNTKILLLQIVFGCGGNILNLIVLLSRTMRSRTNLIFAAMAFADLFFLILHIPSVLFFIGTIRDAPWYRNGFSQVIAGMLNWSSAVSIWFMMYATIERVQVFRSPFRTSKRSASTRFFLTLFFIALFCLLLTVVHFIHPKTRAANKYARYVVVSLSLPLFPHKKEPNLIMTHFQFVHMIFVVIIPMVLSTSLNILLVCALRKNSMPLRMLNDSHVHQSLIVQRTRTERKVTAMVTVILSSFIACNVPGSVVFVMKESDDHFDDSRRHILMQAVCNSLAVTGKVLNFLLFCLSSEHFRALLKKRLCYLFHLHHDSSRRHNMSTTATKTFSVPLNDL